MAQPGQKQVRLRDRQRRIAQGQAAVEARLASAFKASHGENPEEIYRGIVPLHHRQHYGQFFTPQPISTFMARWVSDASPTTLLDPAVGTGVFLRAVARIAPAVEVTAIDIDRIAIEAAKRAVPNFHSVTFLHTDFLMWEDNAQFDAIIANPPYLRHHELDYGEYIFNRIGDRSGIRLTRLTNIYALFLLEICNRLRVGGRAAVITPGEWLNANFGLPIKRYLLDRGMLRHLVYFSHAELPFSDALTTGAILLLEKNGSHVSNIGKVHTYFIRDARAACDAFADEGAPLLDIRGALKRSFAPSALRDSAKWDAVLEHGISEEKQGFVPLRCLAITRRGIATGANAFFHVSESVVRRSLISNHIPRECVGGARNVKGYIFGRTDFEELRDRNGAAFLLDFREPLSHADLKYLAQGELDGLPSRYLLASRRVWYECEQREPANIWAAVFGRGALRFIWNTAAVRNLTTFHCIYVSEEYRHLDDFVPALTACLNSVIVQELARSHRRVYGNGLNKFEPRDLLDIPVPDLRYVSIARRRQLCDLLHTLHLASSDTAVLATLDTAVNEAASEAAKFATLHPGAQVAYCHQSEVLPLWEQHMHHADPDE